MNKRVFLYAFGEDYSAMEFESNYNIQEFYEQMVKEGVKDKVINDEYYIHVRILEFGEIDDDFIDFIRDNIMDYDRTKAEDFFEVKPISKEE